MHTTVLVKLKIPKKRGGQRNPGFVTEQNGINSSLIQRRNNSSFDISLQKGFYRACTDNIEK